MEARSFEISAMEDAMENARFVLRSYIQVSNAESVTQSRGYPSCLADAASTSSTESGEP